MGPGLIRYRTTITASLLVTALGVAGWAITANVSAQDNRRVAPGTAITVRTSESIDVDRQDNRVYSGAVETDIRDDDGRIVIPRGSSVELFVRVAADQDLILDLESIVSNGERYAVRAEPNRIESQRDNSLVGSIVGALGGQVRGTAVRIPRDSVVTFRLERPLYVGVPDRGIDRDGRHYHDRDDRDNRDDRRRDR
jgi:hypothetical protein